MRKFYNTSSSNDKLDKSLLQRLYQQMSAIRIMENKLYAIYMQRDIFGYCHLYTGQEAVAVGSLANISNDDMVTTTYRCHGHSYLRGVSFFEIIAELMGKQGGISKGRGGSMHMFNIKNNFYGGHGIVGVSSSIGTGTAFYLKYKKQSGVALAFLGDGSTNQGQFYESMNMAKLWNLPIIYIIENNLYAMGTSIKRGVAGKLKERGASFGIKGFKGDGQDVKEVYNLIKKAVNHVKSNSEPVVVELDTYRYRGHSMSDPGNYRSREEVAKYKKRDPIDILKTSLQKEHNVAKSWFDNIDKELTDQVNEAHDRALADDFPKVEDLYDNIYV